MAPSMAAKLTASSGIIPFIPLTVFEEILLRLDAQTLLQCTLVCRDWNNLITSPYFVSRSSDRTFDSKNQILLIKVSPCKESAANFYREYIYLPHCRVTYSLHWDNDPFDLFYKMGGPTIDDLKDTKVIGISNGLVCLANELPFKFILWNPTFRKYAWLPLPMMWEEKLSKEGFGFDRSSNDFKVVNLLHRYCDEYKINRDFDSAWIFSYVTWSWKSLPCDILHSCVIAHTSSPVFFNGVLHWLAVRMEDFHVFILTFDLTREVFGKILFPDGAVHGCSPSIVTTGDSFLFIQEIHVQEDETEEEDQVEDEEEEDLVEDEEEEDTVEDEDDDDLEEEEEDENGVEVVSNFFSVWIMKEYGNHESWTNISSITSEMDPIDILGARKNGNLILHMGDGQICEYNPTTSTNTPMKVMEDSVFFCYYTESLYLLEKEENVNSY